MATALDLLMSAKEDVNLLSEESDICTIDAKTRAIFVPSTIVVGGVQSDKNAERIKFSCPKIVGDNLDLSKFSVRINFENVSSVDFNVSIKDQYICDDVAVDGENVTFSWLIGRNAARYMGTVRFIVCAVKTDSDSNISVEWNTAISEVPVLEGIEIDQPQIGQEEKDVINQLLELTKNTSAEAVQNVNSAKEQAIKDIQSVSQPDTTLTIEGGLAEAKAVGDKFAKVDSEAASLKEDIDNKIEVVKPVNLFNKKNVVVGKYVRGENGDKIAELENSAFNYVLVPIKPKTQYITTGTSFNTYFLDENNTIIERKGSSQGNPEFSFICEYDNVKNVAINYRPALYHTETYMVVEGATLPSTYTPYFDAYYKFKLSQYYATLNDIKANAIEEYHVGVSKDYTKFIECLKALKDNTNNKVIYVDGGNYDIFSEIGGKSFCDTIPEGETAWQNYSVFIPPNTTVIGVGDVFFNFNPSIDEIGNGLKLLSPINIQGTCHLENITINASNCRYCIHDETEGDAKFIGAKKSYKNVHCIKSGGGLSQAYSCGFDDLMTFSFDNCIFESTLDAFSMHNRGTDSANKSSRININECVFIGKKMTIQDFQYDLVI